MGDSAAMSFVHNWMAQGAKAYSLGDFARALECFTQALHLKPDHDDALHNCAATLLQLQRHDEALDYYAQLLQRNPLHVEALCGCGLAMLYSGFAEQALTCIDRALQLQADHVGSVNNRGLALRALGRLAEATACFERLLQLQPQADACNHLGLCQLESGHAGQALENFDALLRQWPGHAQAQNNRALALRALRRRDEALDQLDRLLSQEPRYAEAWGNRGMLLLEAAKFADALASLDRGLALAPTDAGMMSNRGLALQALRRYTEALDCFDTLAQMHPDDDGLQLKRAAVLRDLDRNSESLECCERLLGRMPDHVEALRASAHALFKLERYDDSLERLEHAIAIDPFHAPSLSSHGFLLDRLNRREEALIAQERALAVDPNHADAMLNRSMAHLALGDLQRGFQDFHSRWLCSPLNGTRLGSEAPLWSGQPLPPGSVLLVWHEQGFGDSIQFVRYAQLAAERGLRVWLRMPRPLLRLMRSAPGVECVIDATEPLPAHDAHCPLLDLPAIFGTTLDTVPAASAYLEPQAQDRERWSALLGPRLRPRIGLVWAGRQYAPVNWARDMPLAQLRPLFDLDADLVSLQKDIPEQDRALLVRLGGRLLPHGESLGDFADTAALIAELDLVIGVDTAVAHVAAAIGKPMWLMNRHASCWRWLQQRSDSPWYPSLRLFRQPRLGDWTSVVAEVHSAARQLVGHQPRSTTEAESEALA